MSETNHQDDPQIVAGEYVLGTMDEDARAEFEKNRAANAVLCKHADDWERDLSRLTDALPDVTPPARAWQNIVRQMTSETSRSDPAASSKWRLATLILGGVSLLLLALLVLRVQ